MRSSRGLLGSILLLLALPIAVLTQVLFGSGSGIAIHLALAVGCVLVSFSAFDFGAPSAKAASRSPLGTSTSMLSVVRTTVGMTMSASAMMPAHPEK